MKTTTKASMKKLKLGYSAIDKKDMKKLSSDLRWKRKERCSRRHRLSLHL
jgi:hypothetical protein